MIRLFKRLFGRKSKPAPVAPQVPTFGPWADHPWNCRCRFCR